MCALELVKVVHYFFSAGINDLSVVRPSLVFIYANLSDHGFEDLKILAYVFSVVVTTSIHVFRACMSSVNSAPSCNSSRYHNPHLLFNYVFMVFHPPFRIFLPIWLNPGSISPKRLSGIEDSVQKIPRAAQILLKEFTRTFRMNPRYILMAFSAVPLKISLIMVCRLSGASAMSLRTYSLVRSRKITSIRNPFFFMWVVSLKDSNASSLTYPSSLYSTAKAAMTSAAIFELAPQMNLFG